MASTSVMSIINQLHFNEAAQRLAGIITRTPLQLNRSLSKKYNAEIYLKREDLQVIRSYKIRGAFNKMASMSMDELGNGVAACSAGNHAQGCALACKHLKVKGHIFMPITTPSQKVKRTRLWGEDMVDVTLIGDNFDACASAAKAFADERGLKMIHPFDDLRIIEGQGTVATEILEDIPENPDYIILPVGGGGLAAGVGSALKQRGMTTTLVGVEPAGAPSMTAALRAGHPVTLHKIDTFVDGAAVRRVGDLNFKICEEVLGQMLLVHEGKVCSTSIQMYTDEAMVVEPAGCLSIAALDDLRLQIRGKRVVCVVSGSNNDIERMQEIKERSLLYEGLRHYLLVKFPQRPGALREFVADVLGPRDDIIRFEYVRRNRREEGPALIGIDVAEPEDFRVIVDKLVARKVDHTVIESDDKLFALLH